MNWTARVGLTVILLVMTTLGFVVYHGVDHSKWAAHFAANQTPHLVTLIWTAAPGAVSYNVYRGTKSGGPYDTKLGPTTDTTFANSPVMAGTYYYVVTSVGKNGKESKYSEEIKARVTD